MSSLIKRARIRYTFGGQDASGWIPPHAPMPPRAPEKTVDLVVQIERANGGFILQWIGPAPEFCGDHWYLELPYAEHAAEELFGITADQWDAVGLTPVATDEDWTTYHAIRRRVLFELRGNGASYDENHPDERRPGHYAFLLWDADTPVGVIRVDIDGDRATFRRVAIREDLQRRGYGRQLLEAAEQFARQHRCTRVESHVDPDAVGFYERCGFTRANPDDSDDPAPLMIKLFA